jgi:16S rRNA processing protein RimM
MNDDRLILMATIGKPHGVRGLVRVNAYTEDGEALAEYPLSDRQGRRFTIEWVNEPVARLSELTSSGPRVVADRNEAEKLTNLELFSPRSALPDPDEEEFYLADLIGLSAKDGAGQMLGTIAAVHDYGGGTSLEIAPGALLVPFTKVAVPVIDISGGVVVINPPAETSVTP